MFLVFIIEGLLLLSSSVSSCVPTSSTTLPTLSVLLRPLHRPSSNFTLSHALVPITTTTVSTIITTVPPTEMSTTTTLSGLTTTTTTTAGPPTTTTTTTTTAPTNCCDPPVRIDSPAEFADGIMTFAYDSDACRSTVTVRCSQGDPAFDLNAAIVANGENFLDIGAMMVTFPGTCAGGRWFMGTPPLLIQTLECRLTNPPPG